MEPLKLILIGLFFCNSVARAQVYYPFIQTHTFQMEPYLKNCQGYAFFIYSAFFSGKEIITVNSPKDVLFPDTKTNSRALDQYSNGQWYLSDKERLSSATNGPLNEGTYFFNIQNGAEIATIPLNYLSSFLSPVKNISLSDLGASIDVNWNSDSKANSFWIFIFPSNTKNILQDLIAVSSVMHLGNHYTFQKLSLNPGKYKIAIRSNQFWEGGTYWGFKSEAWAISDAEFTIQ
jgi:hypothetical protein